MGRTGVAGIFRGRLAGVRKGLLAQVLLCVVPAMAAVAVERPGAGAYWLFGCLSVLLAWHMATRKPAAYLTLVVATIPAAMELRDFFYFSSLTVMLAAGFLLWGFVRTRELRRVGRHGPLAAFLAAAALYWWMSYMYTGAYSSNMRMLELGFSAAAIFLLGAYRSYLATALVGIGLTAVAVGAGLSPYGHRLGMADIGDRSMGNPISLGLPAALVLLLGLAHGGRWLLAEARPVFRPVLMMAVAVCLLLSTSRGSWLVAVVGFLVIFASTRQRRVSILLSLVPLVIVGGLVLASGRGEYIRMYLGRAVDPGQSMAQRTTGRSKQWAAMPQILAGSPVWGYGPGSGMDTNIRFTGVHKAFHSLYLQVAVELGGIGIVLLTLLLGALVARAVRHRRLTGDAVPLTGILCFMTIVVSVSGVDAISGVFLGLGFLAQDYTGMYVMREAVPAPGRTRFETAPAEAA